MAINPNTIATLFNLLQSYSNFTNAVPPQEWGSPAQDMLDIGNRPGGFLSGMPNSSKGNVIGIANSIVRNSSPGGMDPYAAPSNMQQLAQMLTKSAGRKLK